MRTNSSFLVYQLKLAQANRWIATIYTDLEDPDALHAGYVERVDARHVLLDAVTPWGHLDGYILRRMEDVKQVYCNEDEEMRLQELQRIYDHKPEPFLPPEEEGADILRAMLELAYREKHMVSLMTEEETYTGMLLHVDDLRVSLEALDFFGMPAMQPLSLRLRDLTMVAVGGEEENMFQALYAERMKLVRPDPGR